MATSLERERRIGSRWFWAFVAGVIVLVAGFVAMFHPFVTNVAMALLLGWSLIAAGASAIVAGFSDLRARGGWLYVLLGVLGILAGLVVIFNPLAGMISLVWAVGCWLIVGGILELFGGLSAQSGKMWLMLVGLVDILLGVVLMFMDPISALALLAMVVGLSLAIRGIGLILFSLRLRRLHHRLTA